MALRRLGKQPPRFKFFLNPYQDARFTRCPKCEAKTRQKKLPLVIHIDDWGMFVLNKTCRFCPGCQLLIAHKDELEGYLAAFFERQAPEIVGNDFLVIGTVDRADWKRGAKGSATTEEMIDRLHDFENVLRFRLAPPLGAAEMNSQKTRKARPSRPAPRAAARAGVLIAGALTLAALANAEPPGSKPGIKTDRGTYLPVPTVKLPKAGGTFVDPAFGTEILRATDEADGRENQNAYSYWPSFNKDATKFFICCGGRAMLYRFDSERFRILSKEPLFPEKPPEGGWPGWEDAIWSGASPDLLFCHSGLKLWSYNVQTRQYTLVKDFTAELSTGNLRQMSKSLDDRVFGFTRQDAKYAVVGYLVWDRQADRLLLNQQTRQLDEIQVDNSGKLCVIKTGRGGKGVVEVRVADLRTGKVEDLVDNEPDYAPDHSDNGHGIVVGADNWKNRITFRRLDGPHQVRTVLDLGSDWSQDCHISLLADDERWALVSFYVGNKLRSSGVFQNEIIQVATDGSQRVRRLAHHRSVVREYWDSPRANISRDGRFVIFTSNVEGRGQRDVFILKVPPPDPRESP